MDIVSGNKGEWSELYVLGFLLANGGAHAADGNQNPKIDSFYKILEVFLEGQSDESFRHYKIGETTVDILSLDKTLSTIDRKDIKAMLEELLTAIQEGGETSTFKIDTGYKLMKKLERDRLAAASSNANDLEMKLMDVETGTASPRQGFSVKSQMGSPATLLNASGATNVTFRLEVPHGVSEGELLELNKLTAKPKFQALGEKNVSLKFVGFDSKDFERNLSLIDSRMPEYLAEILAVYYFSNASSLKDITETVYPPGYSTSFQPTFKIKQFVGSVAMGMRPSSPWDGDVTKFKGLILAKMNGDVLLYNLYNLRDFEDFLFQNLKFEKGSQSRHKFLDIYKSTDSDGLRIKLNLQLRFTA